MMMPDPVDPGPACARTLEVQTNELQTLRFENASSELAVYIQRKFIEYGPGETVQYGLESFDLDSAGTCKSLAAGSADLEYSTSHHNWADEAAATIDGVRYSLQMDYEIGLGSWEVFVTGTQLSDGTVTLPRTELQPTGGPIICWTCPGHIPVVITEVLLENSGVHRDEAGDADPWLELWNPSAEAVDLSGWELVSSGTVTGKYVFPAGTMIGRHLFLVVWLDGETSEGALHAPFLAQKSGMYLRLQDPAGETPGERAFNSPGADLSLDLNFSTGGYSQLAPTPNAASVHQMD